MYKLKIIQFIFIIGILLQFSFQISATPAVIPNCPAGPEGQPQENQLGLTLTTYDTLGYDTYPSNHSEYDTLVANYGTSAKEFGTGRVANINGSGNPYGSQDNYLSIFSGYIQAPTTGIYGIGLDGDDAIEVIIDDVVVTGWYGGHGKAGSAQYTVDINLDAGYHTLVFRHQEKAGGDNYYLYWKKPGDSGFSIVPSENLSSCIISLSAISPICSTPSSQLQHSTYDTTGYIDNYPDNHDQYNILVDNYAIPSKKFGSGLVSTINGSGNPYGVDSSYLSIFKGYLKAPTDGVYQIGLDGDDAIEVLIDGTIMTGWYGSHGNAGSAQATMLVYLEAGYHDLEFRHQEYLGGDNYYLYWKTPADTSLAIIPASNLYNCPLTAKISLSKTSKTLSDPFNGTTNPKAIPGAVIEYTLTALNSGDASADNNIIKDSLDSLITTQQHAIWASGFLTIKTPNLYGGAKTTLTDSNDSDEGYFIDTAGNREVTVNCGTLTTGQDCIVTYRIIIN